jgi:Domain of unknown function (DUF3819)
MDIRRFDWQSLTFNEIADLWCLLPQQNIPDPVVVLSASDNLDLACSVVEKVAVDKAVAEIDEALAPAFTARRKHREVGACHVIPLCISGSIVTLRSQRSNQAFWDTAAIPASHYSGSLPDPLRLKLGGLQPQQLRVYEAFSNLRPTPPPVPAHGVGSIVSQKRTSTDDRLAAPRYRSESPLLDGPTPPGTDFQAYEMAAATPASTVTTPQQALEKFGVSSANERCTL